MDDIKPVFTERAFSKGFNMLDQELRDLISEHDMVFEAVKKDKGEASKKAIGKMTDKINKFYIQLRANVVARFNGRKYEANMKKINKAIEKNPDLLNVEVEYVDYDVLIKKCENAKKALTARMEAYAKICSDNKELLSKKELTKEETRKLQKIDKQLRAIAYGECKWSKGKITKGMLVATGAVMVIRGATLYGKYTAVTKTIDRDLAARASDAQYLNMFKDRVGISTRTSGYTVSIAEEYSQLLSTEGRLYMNRISELLQKLLKIISTPGARTMSNAGVKAVSAAKYLESVDDCLMNIFESLDEPEPADTSEDLPEPPTPDNTNDHPDDETVEEDSDEYDPMSDLF